MKLRVNLSTEPLENTRPFLAGTALAGALAVLALVALSGAAYRSWRANRDMHLQISHDESEISAYLTQQQDLATFFKTSQAQQVLDRAAFLNSLIGQRSFPWTKLFMDIEQILPPGVRVISISPKLESGRAEITLSVGATSDENEIKFLKALEESRAFSNVRVGVERRVSEQNSQDKVELSLTVWYETL